MSSTRIKESEARKSKKRQKEKETRRQIKRRQPHKCQHCHRQARHGCNLCRECSIQRNQQRALRSEFLINQGCPYILGKTKGTFRWHQKFPELALWMLTTLNLREDPPLKHSRSKTVEVLGWKEGTDMNEARSIDGMILIRPYWISKRLSTIQGAQSILADYNKLRSRSMPSYFATKLWNGIKRPEEDWNHQKLCQPSARALVVPTPPLSFHTVQIVVENITEWKYVVQLFLAPVWDCLPLVYSNRGNTCVTTATIWFPIGKVVIPRNELTYSWRGLCIWRPEGRHKVWRRCCGHQIRGKAHQWLSKVLQWCRTKEQCRIHRERWESRDLGNKSTSWKNHPSGRWNICFLWEGIPLDENKVI